MYVLASTGASPAESISARILQGLTGVIEATAGGACEEAFVLGSTVMSAQGDVIGRVDCQGQAVDFNGQALGSLVKARTSLGFSQRQQH